MTKGCMCVFGSLIAVKQIFPIDSYELDISILSKKIGDIIKTSWLLSAIQR